MDWKYLYTSFDGRIGRKSFWFGFLGFIVIGIVLSIIANVVTGGFNVANVTDPETARSTFLAACIANIIVFAIMAYPSAALLIKRRHDRGSSGQEVWAYIAFGLLLQIVGLVGFDYSAVDLLGTGVYAMQPGLISTGLSFLYGVFAIYLLVVCGFLKGDSGDNAYGPDPLADS